MGYTYEQEKALFYQLQNKLVALKYKPGIARVAHYVDLENSVLDLADRLVENIKACVARRHRRHHFPDDLIRRWEELNRMCRELAAEAGRLKEETRRMQAARNSGGSCSARGTCRRRRVAKELDVPRSLVEEG